MPPLAAKGTGWFRQVLAPNLFFILVVLVLLWLIAFPIGQMVVQSFRSGHPAAPGPFTLQNYITAYSHPLTYRMMWNTFVFATASTFITMGLAVLFAWLIERTDMPLRNLAWTLLLVPLAMPGLLFSMAWVLLLSPDNGIINQLLRVPLSAWFGIEMAKGPINIYSMGGMIFLDGLRGVTTVFLIIVGAFRMMDPALEEAARTAGASTQETLRKITLPVLLPAILAGFLYSYMSSMESFEAPLVVGLPAGIYVYSTMIYFSTRLVPSYGLGAAFSVSYFLIAIFLVWIYQRAIIYRTERFATVTGKGYRPHVIPLGKWRHAALGLFILYFVFAVILPLVVLVWTSLLPHYRTFSWQQVNQLTLTHYQALFQEAGILNALWNTVIVTFFTATGAVLLSFYISWIVVRTKIRGRFLLDSLAFLSHAVPGIIVALAFIFLYIQPPFRYLGLYGTVWIIILALVTQYIAFSTRTMNAAITQVHKELEEAGRVSGANRVVVLMRITLPLVFPALAAAWIWVAAHAVRAFSVPLMLASRDNWTIAVLLWHYWDEAQSISMATTLGVVLMLAITVMTFLGRRLIVRAYGQ